MISIKKTIVEPEPIAMLTFLVINRALHPVKELEHPLSTGPDLSILISDQS
jgi:hypothetical protein